MGRVVIMGGGLTGALAALAARRTGADVLLGGDPLEGADRTSGVFEFAREAAVPGAGPTSVEAVRALSKVDHAHPYAMLGARREAALRAAHELLVKELDAVGLRGPGLDANGPLLLAGHDGALHPAVLAQESHWRGDLRTLPPASRVGIVSISGLQGVDAPAVAKALGALGHAGVVLPVALPAGSGAHVPALASWIDEGGRGAFVAAVLAAAKSAKCRYVFLPTAGYVDPSGVCDELFALGLAQAAELVTAPGVAGTRLAHALVDRLARARVASQAREGAGAPGAESIVVVDAAARPAAAVGAAYVDMLLRPVDATGALLEPHVFLAGAALAGADPAAGWTGLGVAAVTAIAAGENAAMLADGASRATGLA